jgi:hypothetical protein
LNVAKLRLRIETHERYIRGDTGRLLDEPVDALSVSPGLRVCNIGGGAGGCTQASRRELCASRTAPVRFVSRSWRAICAQYAGVIGSPTRPSAEHYQRTRRRSRGKAIGVPTLFVLLVALVGAVVSGVAAADWANSAVGLPESTQVTAMFTPARPERALVGASPVQARALTCAPESISLSELFAALHGSIGDTFGQPVECPRIDASTGDTVQRTSTGLAIYRAHSRLPTFTDGYHRWAIGPGGVITWQGDALDPPP